MASENAAWNQDEATIAEALRTGTGAPEFLQRGYCPTCGSAVVSDGRYVEGKGYVIFWRCWQAISGAKDCDYKKVV